MNRHTETDDYDNRIKTNRNISRLGFAFLWIGVAIFLYYDLVEDVNWLDFFKTPAFMLVVALQLIGYTMGFYAAYQKSKVNAIVGFLVTFGSVALIFLIIKLLHPTIWT